jgi:hypothetical protein
MRPTAMYAHKTEVVAQRPISGMFRKTYSVVCAYCGLELGPFHKQCDARNQASQLSEEVCGENW